MTVSTSMTMTCAMNLSIMVPVYNGNKPVHVDFNPAWLSRRGYLLGLLKVLDPRKKDEVLYGYYQSRSSVAAHAAFTAYWEGNVPTVIQQFGYNSLAIITPASIVVYNNKKERSIPGILYQDTVVSTAEELASTNAISAPVVKVPQQPGNDGQVRNAKGGKQRHQQQNKKPQAQKESKARPVEVTEALADRLQDHFSTSPIARRASEIDVMDPMKSVVPEAASAGSTPEGDGVVETSDTVGTVSTE